MDRPAAVAPGSPSVARESPHLVGGGIDGTRESRSLPGFGRPTGLNPDRDHPRLPRPAARPPPRHPFALSSPTADERLQQVLAAYALLRDPARRANYDRATEVTADAANTGPHSPTVPPSAVRPFGPVQIPITHRHNKTATAPAPAPALRAGPVRRHQ